MLSIRSKGKRKSSTGYFNESSMNDKMHPIRLQMFSRIFGSIIQGNMRNFKFLGKGEFFTLLMNVRLVFCNRSSTIDLFSYTFISRAICSHLASKSFTSVLRLSVPSWSFVLCNPCSNPWYGTQMCWTSSVSSVSLSWLSPSPSQVGFFFV